MFYKTDPLSCHKNQSLRTIDHVTTFVVHFWHCISISDKINFISHQAEPDLDLLCMCYS